MNQEQYNYILDNTRKIFQDYINNHNGIMSMDKFNSIEPNSRNAIMREMKQLGIEVKQYKSKPNELSIERNKNKSIEEAIIITEV